MVNDSAVKVQLGGPGENSMANVTTAITARAMAPPTSRPVRVPRVLEAGERGNGSAGAGVGTRTDARIAARKPSTSSGRNSAVLALVITATRLLRLVTYQVQLPSFAVLSWP